MLPRTVAVAAIQPDCSSSSVEANLNALAAQVAQAGEQGADIVLLPERFSEAFQLGSLRMKVGLIVATVHMDPSKKHFTLPPEVDRYRPWIAPVPLDWRSFAIFEWFGRRAYRRSRERAALASRTVANDHAGKKNP